MAALTPLNRPGQANGAGQPDVNLLRVFGGEVLTAFSDATFMLPLTNVKNLMGAGSYAFPALGKTTATYHVPGANLLTDNDAAASPYLKQIKSNSAIVYPDRRLVVPLFIDKLDQMLTHWDARQEYALETARALARQIDRNILGLIFNASNAAATVTGNAAGTEVFAATVASSAAAFVDTIFRAKVALDRNLCPKEDRYLVTTPEQMRLLFTDGAGAISGGLQWVNRDFNDDRVLGTSGGGGFNTGKVPMLAGFKLYESTLFQGAANTTYNGGDYNFYSTSSTNDYSFAIPAAKNLVATAFHKSCVGTVKVEDLKIESEYLIEYQGTFMVASMVLGHGILRPESTCSIQDATI